MSKNKKRKKSAIKYKILLYILIALAIFIAVFLVTGIYNVYKPLPKGLSYEGKAYPISDAEISFLYDLNYRSYSGETIIEQEIFDNVFSIINGAQEFIVIDMFLFNNDSADMGNFTNLSSELKEALILKKRENPGINITFITDEINNFYGSYTADHLEEMREEGINVVLTNMGPLRDSNPLASSIWRSLFQWFGTKGGGWIKHPLGNSEKEVTLRSVIKASNYKANHRKLIVADSGQDIVSLVTSANPHDASSKHSNVAVRIRGDMARDILEAENAVTRISNGGTGYSLQNFDNSSNSGDITVQFITEGKIKKHLLKEIRDASQGDSIDIAMFYLSDRDIINALLEASERNISVRLVLDPNKDAFGSKKNGIPNRQVAYELYEKSNGKIQIRWYSTEGEQFHTKMIIIRKNGKIIVFIGSANLTRRNIQDFNLEADVKAVAPENSDFAGNVSAYYRRIWDNEDALYTLNFENYSENSGIKYLQYRFGEFSGISTF